MEWVEASGKTLAEAKEIVLDHLGVAEDDAEFVIVSEPKAGLFGRQRGEARVQARVRPVAPPPSAADGSGRTVAGTGQGRSRSGEGSARRNGANADRGDQGGQRSERGRSSSQSRPRSGPTERLSGTVRSRQTAARRATVSPAEPAPALPDAVARGDDGRRARGPNVERTPTSPWAPPERARATRWRNH